MGRKPIGQRPMNATERQREHRKKVAEMTGTEVIELMAKAIFEGKADRQWKTADESERMVFRHTAKLALEPVKKFFRKRVM